MWPVWVVQIIIAVAVAIIAYLLTPKPKPPKPPAAKDLDSPTADAGRPVPVVFGDVTMNGVNVIFDGDKEVHSYEVKA